MIVGIAAYFTSTYRKLVLYTGEQSLVKGAEDVKNDIIKLTGLKDGLITQDKVQEEVTVTNEENSPPSTN